MHPTVIYLKDYYKIGMIISKIRYLDVVSEKIDCFKQYDEDI